jgi:hypothetical protein
MIKCALTNADLLTISSTSSFASTFASYQWIEGDSQLRAANTEYVLSFIHDSSSFQFPSSIISVVATFEPSASFKSTIEGTKHLEFSLIGRKQDTSHRY